MKTNRPFIYLCLFCLTFFYSQAQDSVPMMDSSSIRLKTAIIEVEKDNSFGITRLKQVEGTAIYAGKKSEVILLNDVNGNTATNNSRQIYAKVAGLNIWENDGAGIQLGIGGRGLSPNRVSNFNTRQNGYDISADALGYPESYYTPPTEALERIEIVRGAASLQYGTQFGGFINFKMKQGTDKKKLELIARQTLGSFGFYNAFTSIGGSIKKINYYTMYQYKTGNGWRPNSHFAVHTAFTNLNYQINSKLRLGFDYTYMSYLAQQAGGLTDKQFTTDPRQSNRTRNWFNVNWNLGAITFDYLLSSTARVNWRSFGLYAQRDALGNLTRIDRADNLLSNRNYLQDKFRNYGTELRYLQQYHFLNSISTFLVGARYYKGNTLRKQGLGNSKSSPDFYYLNPDNLEHSDYHFPSENISIFSENVFRIGSKLTITPGIRWEYINTNSMGYYHEESRDLAGNLLYERNVEDNRSSDRSFMLVGLGIGYKFSTHVEAYANFSQNYRSINFNDMRIVNPNAQVDPNLHDEKGYSADAGVRGNLKKLLNFDISLFLLKYNDRIGSIQRSNNATQIYRYRTNISDSRNMGLESFVELDLFKLIGGKESNLGISIFSNYSFIDARYINSEEASVKNGNKVELVPTHIFRSGINIRYKELKLTCQYAYTSEQFTEATNTLSTVTAVDGLIPSYQVMDLSVAYSYKCFSFSSGINNLANIMYFTRRADGYPGPGIIPADGRSFYITLQVKI